MLRNYLKIALRTLWRQKGITAINVLGLAAGMAVCLLMGLLFWDQASHDDFHPGAERIYRVTTLMGDDARSTASSPAPLAPTLRENVVGIETATRMRPFSRTLVHNNQGYNVEGLYADSSFFDLFGFELVAGEAQRILATPHTAVVTQTLARRLYGEENPVGRTFRLQGGERVTVTGVVDRSKHRSHLAFEVLVSFETLRHARSEALTEWRIGGYDTSAYVRLQKSHSPATVEASLEGLRRQHLSLPDDKELSPVEKHFQVDRLQLEPLSAVPFSSTHPNVEQGTLPGIMGPFIAGLALLVLLAASFNHVNLSTARSLTRGREVGVRKTMGAHRQQVMGQFLAEAVIVALLALGLGVVLLQGLVPLFNRLSVVHKAGIGISVEPGLRFYGMAVLFAGGVGVLAGLYPAWHLSSFRPAQVLKTGVQAKTPGFQWITPRKGMIVLQFLIAFVVIVTGTVLYRQFEHMKGGDYPFQVDHVARIELQESDYGPFQQEARRQPGVQGVGATSGIPVLDRGAFGRVELSQRHDSLRVSWYSMDYEAIQLLDLPMIVAEEFTEARFESGQVVLVTESAARQFGFASPREALGQPLRFQNRPDGRTQQVRIAGILEDLSGDDKRGGRVLFQYAPEGFQLALARTASGRDSTALSRLQSTWEQVATDPFKGTFIRAYVGEKGANALGEFGVVMGVIAVLAVLISCLGLLGIVTYTVQTRSREIGIRKTLGATASSIVGLLSKDVLWLVGTAILIGMPIAWMINRQVLRNFSFSIDVGLVTLLLTALAMIAVAFLSVAPPTLRAARTDPATTLRDE